MLKALSVSELNEIVKNIFEAEELLHYIKVYGEVSNLSFVRGNLYFNLKDENALIPCIMFGVSNNSVKEGDQIMTTGSLRFYVKSGKLNLYVTSIAPYGSGILFQKFIELKNKLEQEGIFDKKYKKELPKEIKKIGVITSATGAVIHDIVTVSHRRNPYLNIVVFPARVQGDGAETTIINGLKYFDKQKDIDVIIIARGGGSIEDLQPFNTESLAREIISVSKPVISAVGHEVDFTICDFASSIRAATPSEAAEIVSKDISNIIKEFKLNFDKLYYLICSTYDEKYLKFDTQIKQLLQLENKLILNKQYKLLLLISRLKNINFVFKFEKNLDIKFNKLLALNVEDLVNRGFVRVSKNNKIIKSINDINLKDNIIVEFKDGILSSTINEIRSKKNEF